MRAISFGGSSVTVGMRLGVDTTDAEHGFACPGDGLEWCDAGDRLSIYFLSG